MVYNNHLKNYNFQGNELTLITAIVESIGLGQKITRI